jgi:hypothetical protein
MITGAILIGVALALAVWKQMWFAAANPTSRLSLMYWPPNVPFGARTLQATSWTVLLVAAFQLAERERSFVAMGAVWPSAVCRGHIRSYNYPQSQGRSHRMIPREAQIS